MRERHSPTPTPDRPISIQPSVAANGACWRRQAVSVVSGAGTKPNTEYLSEPPTSKCGDGRHKIQEKS